MKKRHFSSSNPIFPLLHPHVRPRVKLLCNLLRWISVIVIVNLFHVIIHCCFGEATFLGWPFRCPQGHVLAQPEDFPTVACTRFQIQGSGSPLRPTDPSISVGSVNWYHICLESIKHCLVHRQDTASYCTGQIHIAKSNCLSEIP